MLQYLGTVLAFALIIAFACLLWALYLRWAYNPYTYIRKDRLSRHQVKLTGLHLFKRAADAETEEERMHFLDKLIEKEASK